MAIEHIGYEGSANEERDISASLGLTGSLADVTQNFSDSGEPLGPTEDAYADDWDAEDDGGDAWDAEDGSDGTEAYSEPSSLLEAARAEVQGLSPEEMQVVWETWPEATQRQVLAESQAEQARAAVDRQAAQFAQTFEAQTAWRSQREALSEQAYEDREVAGREEGLAIVEQFARDAHARIDVEAVYAQAIEAVDREAALMRHQGFAPDDDWMVAAFEEKAQQDVAKQAQQSEFDSIFARLGWNGRR